MARSQAGFACSGRAIYGRLLDIHDKEQHQKTSIQVGDDEVEEERIHYYGYICVCATTPKPPRGIAKGVLGLGGVGRGVLPSHSGPLYLLRSI
jgi:hypothetical protein